MMSLKELALRTEQQRGGPPYTGIIIGLDPGHCSGFCVMQDGELIEVGQLHTPDIESSLKPLDTMFQKYIGKGEVRCACEDYRIYGSRSRQHAWSSLHTPRLIGMVETLCMQYDIQLVKQPAYIAKAFVTNDKLKAWNLYQVGMRHACDALRHTCYYLLFGKTTDKHKPGNRDRRNKGSTVA